MICRVVFIWYDELMERPVFSEQDDQPELDENHPEQLFVAAKAMERWMRRRVKRHEHPQAMEDIVNKLERYVTTVFEGELPDITVQGRDIRYPIGLSEAGPGEYRLQTGPLPLKGDAELYGEHVIEGVFHSFYRGDRNDLRLYMEYPEEPVMTPGGIITPLYSIGMATSDVALTSLKKAEALKGPQSYIQDRLVEYDEQTLKDITRLFNLLNENKKAIKMKLIESSVIITAIEKRAEPTPQFVDALIEVVCLKLDITAPQDFHVRQQRVLYTDHQTTAYKVEGEASHMHTSTHLELIGGFDDRMLGLHFIDKEQRTIQVPVRDIIYMQKSKPKLL